MGIGWIVAIKGGRAVDTHNWLGSFQVKKNKHRFLMTSEFIRIDPKFSLHPGLPVVPAPAGNKHVFHPAMPVVGNHGGTNILMIGGICRD